MESRFKTVYGVPLAPNGHMMVICKDIHHIQDLLNTNFVFEKAETTFSKSEISPSNITHMLPMPTTHPLSWQIANENKITAGHSNIESIFYFVCIFNPEKIRINHLFCAAVSKT